MLSLPDTTTCAQYLQQVYIVHQRTGGVFSSVPEPRGMGSRVQVGGGERGGGGGDEAMVLLGVGGVGGGGFGSWGHF